MILRYVFLFLGGNIRGDPLLDPSRRDGSNKGSQCMFYAKNRVNYP